MIILPFLLLTTTAKPALQHNTALAPLHQTKEAVKVYPTPQAAGSLTVQSSSRVVLSFYLFDLEGNLVYESRLEQRGQQTIEGLHPGTYTYHAFCADEKIKGGKVSIKN